MPAVATVVLRRVPFPAAIVETLPAAFLDVSKKIGEPWLVDGGPTRVNTTGQVRGSFSSMCFRLKRLVGVETTK